MSKNTKTSPKKGEKGGGKGNGGGTMSVNERPARQGRNPRTGKK